MTEDRTIRCASCGATVMPDVPEYYMEIECFRLMTERSNPVPRRGSREYHDAMEKLRPEVREAYFHNVEMYDRGHLWCPVCGSRLISHGGEDSDFRRRPGI